VICHGGAAGGVVACCRFGPARSATAGAAARSGPLARFAHHQRAAGDRIGGEPHAVEAQPPGLTYRYSAYAAVTVAAVSRVKMLIVCGSNQAAQAIVHR